LEALDSKIDEEEAGEGEMKTFSGFGPMIRREFMGFE
jgi:hypothetical protein